MAALQDSTTYVPSSESRNDYANVHNFLEEFRTHRGREASVACFLSGPEPGQQVALPQEIYEALVMVVDAMQRGMAVTIRPNHERITTQQAADLLGVSRPTVVRLVESGELPAEKIGRHRRILLIDVIEYQAMRRQRQLHVIAATSDRDSQIPTPEFFKEVRREVAAKREDEA